MWISKFHQNLFQKQRQAQHRGPLRWTYAVELLVGALQTLLGLLGLHQILQTFIKKIEEEMEVRKGGGQLTHRDKERRRDSWPCVENNDLQETRNMAGTETNTRASI